MTLTISVSKIDPLTKSRIIIPINDYSGTLAGFESWRHKVWGSEKTIKIGAKYLPRLKSGNIAIDGKDLIDFISECEMLKQHYSETDIIFRLNNFVKAANLAIQNNGTLKID